MLSRRSSTVCLGRHLIVSITVFHSSKCAVEQIMSCLRAYTNRSTVEGDVVHELMLEAIQLHYLLLVCKVAVSYASEQLLKL